jgi:biopolymer transport protein ExbD
MTDVIFLLLVFLLIASNFASQTGLPIKLPGSTTSVRQSHQTIQLTYFNDGRLYLNEEPITMTDLPVVLKSKYSDPEQVVRVSAEHNLQIDKLIGLMDVIRSSGFERIFVATTEGNNQQ